MLAGSHKLLLLAPSGRAPTSHVAPRNVLAKLGSTLSGLPPVSNCPSAQQAQSPSKKVLQHNSPSCADRDRLWLLAPALLYSLPASAAEGIKYAPGEGADVVKNIAGIAYAGLIAFWLFKVLGRRVKRGTTERLATEREEDLETDAEDLDSKEVTAGAAALGALQAGFFTWLLYLFSNSVSTYFGRQELPDQYTAKNITVTIRTAVGGLAYLATFIFGANALGLTGLALKLAFFPDAVSSTSKDTAEPSQDDSRL